LLDDTLAFTDSFLSTADTASDCTHTGTTFSRVGTSVDDGADRTANNGPAYSSAGYFLTGAHLIGIGLALFLVDVIATHIDAFAVDDGLINKRPVACTPCQPKAQTKH
jgi:hypothetical protein